jgi:transposase
VGKWTECPVGITSGEKADPPKTLVQEVKGEKRGVRIFVVHSEERLAYERAQRLKAMGRVREGLEALERRVSKGQLKAAAKVGAAAARILQRNHGFRYYDWEYEDGRFRFFEHPVNLKREEAYEGKYVIQTEEKGLSPVQAVSIYKDLSEVERAFCNLKDVLEMRPIFHKTDERVQAHIFVAALAFLLHRAMEKKLKGAGLDLSATEALRALRSVRMVEFRLPDGAIKRSVTRGTARAARVLSALGIAELDPPAPPQEAATVV